MICLLLLRQFIFLLFQNQNFVVFVAFVAANDDSLAGLKTFKHLVILRILPSDADVSAVGFLAILVLSLIHI